MRKILLVATLVATAFVWSGPASAQGGSAVFPPDASPRGMTYPEWEGAYQIWLNEIPTGRNPYVHPDSEENCALVHGVVFLGPFGADCDVPGGHPILLPDGFWECSTGEGLGDTFGELRRCARENFAADFDPAFFQLSVWVDEVKVLHPRRWTFLSPGEFFRFPRNNIWGADPGRTKSVTKGMLWLVRPLVPGDHTLRLHIFGCCDIIWSLHVS
jgi:hypothetical protein